MEKGGHQNKLLPSSLLCPDLAIQNHVRLHFPDTSELQICSVKMTVVVNLLCGITFQSD